MIYLTAQTQIFIAVKPADFRKQIDGLIALCKQTLEQSPRSGALFIFINRSKTMIRILHYDGSGYWLATKRLSQGKFSGWPATTEKLCAIQAEKLMKLIKPT